MSDIKEITLKIGQLEPLEVETDPLMTDGWKIVLADRQKIGQTDRHNVLNLVSGVIIYQQKLIFKI